MTAGAPRRLQALLAMAGLLALGIAAYTRFRRRHHPSSQGGPAFE